MNQIGAPLQGSYDLRLVVLSLLIAILASYVALDLGVRVRSARGIVRQAWLTGGAISMGLGIWSMHFVGMLAFRLPIPVRYNLPTVLISLLAAILASAVALYVVSGERLGRREALVGSLLMGGGIAAMHYLGMAAMRLPATCHYDPLLLGLSIVISVVVSLAALMSAFRFRGRPKRTTLARVASASEMGIAITSMHYVGMASASFANSNLAQDFSRAVSISRLGVAGIVIATLLVSAFALWTSLETRQIARTRELTNVNEALRSEIAERKLAEKAVKQAEDRLRMVIDTIPGLVWSALPDGSRDFLNQRWLEYSGLSRDESLGWGWTAAIHPEDRATFMDEWRAALAAGEPFEKEAVSAGRTGNIAGSCFAPCRCGTSRETSSNGMEPPATSKIGSGRKGSRGR